MEKTEWYQITVARAGDAYDRRVPNMTIAIAGDPPKCNTLAEYATFYEAQAQVLAQALRDSLPGGVLSRLTALLLLQQAGYLRVPLPEPGS